jgi:hypothetical protein
MFLMNFQFCISVSSGHQCHHPSPLTTLHNVECNFTLNTYVSNEFSVLYQCEFWSPMSSSSFFFDDIPQCWVQLRVVHFKYSDKIEYSILVHTSGIALNHGLQSTEVVLLNTRFAVNDRTRIVQSIIESWFMFKKSPFTVSNRIALWSQS